MREANLGNVGRYLAYGLMAALGISALGTAGMSLALWLGIISPSLPDVPDFMLDLPEDLNAANAEFATRVLNRFSETPINEVRRELQSIGYSLQVGSTQPLWKYEYSAFPCQYGWTVLWEEDAEIGADVSTLFEDNCR
ncbi:MAG: hypothetical protein AAF825_08530 [Pseudomonadota bacterium]